MDFDSDRLKISREAILFKLSGLKEAIQPAAEFRLAALPIAVPEIPLTFMADDRRTEVATNRLRVAASLPLIENAAYSLGLFR
jgi:hypothetical protein